MRTFMSRLLEYGLLIIITIPAFASILNPYFFSMHDDQQVARLYVLTEGIKQGMWYPRWVDLFGFNLGYPLFNFYPPLIYYVGLVFHALLGFSLWWSVKLVFISGFILAAIGMYLLVKKLLDDRLAAYTASVFYTYFSYHAVNAYVRGAMAEFFSMSVLPFVFLALLTLSQKTDRRHALWLGLMFAALILTHPLIAVPSLIFIGFYTTHLYFSKDKNRKSFALHTLLGGMVGLGLSAFFWLPSMMERKFTLVDTILTRELASYAIHFIEPFQLWYSPWGFGGSAAGSADGVSFALGKVYIGIVFLSILLYAFIYARKGSTSEKQDYRAFMALLFIALFMCLPYSKFVWDMVKPLWYLQFPWRFLTFVGLFISVIGGYAVYFFKQKSMYWKYGNLFVYLFVLFIGALTLVTYQKYFHPQRYLQVTDQKLTSFDEIAWRVSRTSHEFAPLGVTTKKSDLDTTIIALDKKDVNPNRYIILNGSAQVVERRNFYAQKSFDIYAQTPFVFQLNTFDFPGWQAYLDGKPVNARSDNAYRLMRVEVPQGAHVLLFAFEDTPIRTFANILSIVALAGVIAMLVLGRSKLV